MRRRNLPEVRHCNSGELRKKAGQSLETGKVTGNPDDDCPA